MFQERLQAHLENVPPPERYSLRVIHKNGEIRWVEARTVPMEFQGKPALMTTAIDVSDIKQGGGGVAGKRKDAAIHLECFRCIGIPGGYGWNAYCFK